MNALDRTFRISLVLKGLDGLLELVGGGLALFIAPSQISGLVHLLTQRELIEEPNDFVATHLVAFANGFTVSASVFVAIYLLLHGAVKIVLVVAVLQNRLWAFPWMVAFLLVFVAYQIYQIALSFSIALILLTLFDLFIVWLTLLEYRKRRNSRPISTGDLQAVHRHRAEDSSYDRPSD